MPRNSPKVQAKREKRRDEIVRIAARLFEERGFEDVSLLDIAKHFGKGRTTIYEYFVDKNQLLAACLEQEMAVYHEKIMSIMKTQGPLRDRMREFITVQLVYGTAHTGYSRLFRALTRNSSMLAAETRSKLGKLHAEVYSILSRQIRAAVRRGEIRNVPVELAMQLLINATSLPIRTDADPAKVTEGILDVFWMGMRKENAA
jgi:AcrR family transcriptional regulator